MSHLSGLKPDAIVKSLLKADSAMWCSTVSHTVSSAHMCVQYGVSSQQQQAAVAEKRGGCRGEQLRGWMGWDSSAVSPCRCAPSEQAVLTLPFALLAMESHQDKCTFKAQHGCPYCIFFFFFFFNLTILLQCFVLVLQVCKAPFCLPCPSKVNTSGDVLLLPRPFLIPRELTELPL